MSDIVLLDTTIASFLHPKKKDSDVRKLYDPDLKGKTLALSFQSVAELWGWAEEKNWGESSRRSLDAFVRKFLVIPYDYELAQVWARVMTASRKEGRKFESGDCWIAATAVHRKIPLITHDRDFNKRSIEGLNVVTHVKTF